MDEKSPDQRAADAPAEATPLRPARRKCPICAGPTAERHRPFCSSRCADVDLNRWLSGHYVVAGSEPADEEAIAGAGEDEAG
jgi:uncharacterized protein